MRLGRNLSGCRGPIKICWLNWGSELSILLDLPLEQIEEEGGPVLAEGIRRMRAGE